MPSPVLNDQTFRTARAETDSGWAKPDSGSQYFPPVTDGPATPYRSVHDRMTMAGTMTATGVLFTILLVFGGLGWGAVKTTVDAAGQATVKFPGWLIVAMLGGLGLALLTTFKPTVARFSAPAYAAIEGLVIGAISKVFEVSYPGIVVTAVGATVAVFAVMWFLYTTKIIRVTDKFRRVVMGATMGVVLLYGVSMIIRLFTGSVPLLDGASGLSILVSLVVVGIAAFNLMLDFDMIERNVAAGAPKYMEWYAGFGLMVTLVWLYLEILRLLAKLQDRR